MVILKQTMTIGPKGQVVIPKIFRQSFHMEPGTEVIFAEREGGIVLEKPPIDISSVAREAARRIAKHARVDWDKEHYEQIEKRLKRAGIKI
ncbi:AbrB/MazE/SpoVT family DNA-binding domain-containing protein [Candidatus Woesearchaeota archaeon]|nr:AbrB/MazE/SpoVT family DNA-binding domain-containing protein [Candidatus Woesearchaeota archaeon]